MPYSEIAKKLKAWIESFDKALHIRDLDDGGDNGTRVMHPSLSNL